MREIIIDTETTGLKPADGHRIIEIGGLEMVNHVPTGNTYHVYINPERDIEPTAMAVHGITDEQVASAPKFAEVVDGFLEFIQDSPLVIHNAPFDMGFLNAEFARCDKPELPNDRAIDTLAMARRKFPGGQASLDALCRKFNIDNTHRSLHGAMVDADLLADVYIELIGGKQPGLTLTVASDQAAPQQAQISAVPKAGSQMHEARRHLPSTDELKAHDEFIDGLKDPMWRRLSPKN